MENGGRGSGDNLKMGELTERREGEDESCKTTNHAREIISRLNKKRAPARRLEKERERGRAEDTGMGAKRSNYAQ